MSFGSFVSSSLPKFQEGNNNSAFNYEDSALSVLEDAIGSITRFVPGAVDYLKAAKAKCNRISSLLAHGESAAIYLYTMPTSLFSSLNVALRSESRSALKPWLPFLKLLLQTLDKLPSTEAVIWRGVNYDATLPFVENEVYIWWNITSCSTKISIAQKFLGDSSTLFSIEASNDKNISSFAAISDEDELVLMPGTRLRIKNQSLNRMAHVLLVHLEEIDLPR